MTYGTRRVLVIGVLMLPGTLVAQPIGADALSDLDRLPELRPGVRAAQYSSHDPTGRNQDWTGHLGYSGSERILLDVKGPGCIYRIWCTFSNNKKSDGTIRIYFDNSSTPTVQTTLANFFSGTHPWFPAPLAGNWQVSSGGFYCYVPMPFREGCRITHTNTADLNYHNITFHRYASADGITTFNGQQPLTRAIQQWQQAGADPKQDTGSHAVEGVGTVPAGGVLGLCDLRGAGTIQSLVLTVPAISAQVLSDVRVRMTWNGSEQRAVDVPLGLFFGNGLDGSTTRSLVAGIQGTRLYCYFPMPYRTRAQVELVNTGAAGVALSHEVRYTPRAEPQARVGEFHAFHNRSPQQQNYVDYPFLHATGGGHIVGVVQVMRGPTSSLWYLEGDERFYVDGSGTPALYGTGTEDFYNGGWYFDQGMFTLPLHGAPRFQTGASPAHSCYRMLLPDLVPFTSSIRAGIEHGGWNDTAVDMESVTFHYRSPQPLSTLTDELDVRDAASQGAHQYLRGPGAAVVEASLYYEGEGDQIPAYRVTDQGYELPVGGWSQFKVRLHRNVNAGVILRRRLDYRVPAQQARVLVDGVIAGTWYDAGSNGRFADSEFLIRPELTQGKRQIAIRIENTSSQSKWTEYHYWVTSLFPVVAFIDPDNDGWPDAIDNCPTIANPDQRDMNDDGVGDVCDPDADSDGVPSDTDNCPYVVNSDQADADADGAGDACDRCANTIPTTSVDAEGCPPVVPGDLDGDGDVDQADFGSLQVCHSGPGATVPAPCLPADLDGDKDVDVRDTNIILDCLSGEHVPGNPACAQ